MDQYKVAYKLRWLTLLPALKKYGNALLVVLFSGITAIALPLLPAFPVKRWSLSGAYFLISCLMIFLSVVFIVLLVKYKAALSRIKEDTSTIYGLSKGLEPASYWKDILEEQKKVIRAEEQKKIGMALHDGVVGTLAAIELQLQNELLESGDNASRYGRLLAINNEVTKLYQATREKSHHLFNADTESEGILFAEKISALIDSALPPCYEREVVIDENTSDRIPCVVKIEVLYILQEAITNIRAHSMAQNVVIEVYEASKNLVLKIADDGRGFDPGKVRRSKGIGLRSISKRVQQNKGTLSINTGKNGTELVVMIPI